MTVGEWTSYVKKYASDNNITYKKALSAASDSYRKRNDTPLPIPPSTPETKPKKEKKKPIVEPVVEPILPPQKSNIKKKC
jgi:hypothetical protein